MLRFRRMQSLQKFATVPSSVYNHFNQERHLRSRDNFKLNRAAASTNVLFVYLTYFPVFMFWALDAYFLRQERLFRKLYEHVRGAKGEQADFSMNTQPFEESVDGA